MDEGNCYVEASLPSTRQRRHPRPRELLKPEQLHQLVDPPCRIDRRKQVAIEECAFDRIEPIAPSLLEGQLMSGSQPELPGRIGEPCSLDSASPAAAKSPTSRKLGTIQSRRDCGSSWSNEFDLSPQR